MIPRSHAPRDERATAPTAARVVVGRPIGVLRVVMALSWAIPLLLLAFVARQTWELESDELRARVKSTLGILAEQTEKVFDSQVLALDWIDDRARRLTWAQIEASPELHEFTQSLVERSPYIDTILLADAAGNVRAGSSAWPAPPAASVAGHDYFLAAMQTPRGVHVGVPAAERSSGRAALRVARRRSSADDRFDGIVAISLAPSRFGTIFAEAGGSANDLVCLLRTDGAVLASNADASAGDPCRALWREADAGATAESTTFDAGARVGGVRRLATYPLVLVFAVDLASVRHEWLQGLSINAAAALASSLVLFTLAFAALRLALGEQRAVLAWQTAVEARERIEAERRHASKIEALGRLAGGIAHHFNNLLPAMSGLLERTLHEVPAESDTARRLQRLLEAVAQGRRLVRNILLFSRRQDGARAPVGVAKLLDATLALLRDSLPANVKLVQRLDCPHEVRADAGELQEVFLNLVSNAVHAIGPRDGTIELSVATATVGADEAPALGVRPGPFVRVSCRDDGAGMSADVIERAFDPFFTTKPATEGTGLGLAIVHGVVASLGGHVGITSAPGLGSCVTVLLPQAGQ